MAVRAAIRVELALRAGDIPRAVHGIERPIFEERDGAVYVTFRAQIGPTPQVTRQQYRTTAAGVRALKDET